MKISKTTMARARILLLLLGGCFILSTYSVGQQSDHLFPVQKEGKWGFINKRGVLVIPATFQSAGEFAGGVASVEFENGEWGYINQKGITVIKPQFQGGGDFSEGLAVIIIDGKYGYIDSHGRQIVPPQFDRAYNFSDGLAQVEKQGRISYINKKGEMIIAPKYLTTNDFHSGLASVGIIKGEKLKYGYIDARDKWVIKPKYSWAGDFADGLALVALDGITAGFDGKRRFILGEATYAVINQRGRILARYKFNSITSSFHEGMLAIRVGEKWGYLNTKAEMVIRPQFDAADDFSDGLAVVSADGKRKYIDKTGRTILPATIDGAKKFQHGLAQVKFRSGGGELLGYVNKQGLIVWPPAR
jgi:WG containing repeat